MVLIPEDTKTTKKYDPIFFMIPFVPLHLTADVHTEPKED